MIRNEREYRITQAHAAQFSKSLAEAEATTDASVHPLIRKAQRDALRSQLKDLRRDLAEYEALQEGKYPVLELSSMEELPRALIKARIAAHLTQKDLAERLKIAEQQVQRYEATEYATANLARIMEVVRALGVKIREDVFLPNVDVSPKALLNRLISAGMDRKFVVRRLFGEENDPDSADTSLALKAASLVQKIFGWGVSELFGGTGPLALPRAAAVGKFKLPSNAQERRTVFLAAYAKYLAGVALSATATAPRPIPRDAEEFRRAVIEKAGDVTLHGVLSFLWDRGVPVVPLAETGAFYGACWRINGRNTIVLKQRTASEARWIHDLLHEAYHAGEDSKVLDFETLDQDPEPAKRREDPEEDDATAFAADVLLAGRAEDLVAECVRDASGKISLMKAVVPRVAERNGVPVGALANYLAWRLSLQGFNWWGAATNLQNADEDPWRTTRAFLMSKLDWSKIGERDRELLSRALEEA
ncbi:helix-turn-helix transcriptional regulator [Anaeromyxobacter sp. PSR-1]|uniref:helix-turn-helix transcriptional regulator n=1 Tax=unclassified Anaeromyxobacter TaxID=2620896 RepID=UPI0005E46673|nr:helix-turn-helix transcriptional regulator [Anaeromyxobacter sp. PSR-1]GAO01631.1 helix-turn-helix [Anaeromyxobacter sp. PSR-1]